jgi:hypothetical protein
MNKLTLLILITILTSYAFGQNHISDSTVFLKLGNEKFECKKRYLLYNPNIYGNEDTTFYNPPKFFIYLFKNYQPAYIKTFKHTEYSYVEDEYGEVIITTEYETDSTNITTYFGETSKDSLLILLKNQMLLLDGNNKFPLNNNFKVIISRQDAYRQISGSDRRYIDILNYEIMKAKKGDNVILRDINFNSKEVNYPSYLNTGYWKIK